MALQPGSKRPGARCGMALAHGIEQELGASMRDPRIVDLRPRGAGQLVSVLSPARARTPRPPASALIGGLTLLALLASGCFAAPLAPLAPLSVGSLSVAFPQAPPRNGITTKVDTQDAVVQTADYNLAVGEGVRVLRRHCYRAYEGRGSIGDPQRDCSLDHVSDGTVVATIAPHVLDVRFAAGADFEAGDRIVPARAGSDEP